MSALSYAGFAELPSGLAERVAMFAGVGWLIALALGLDRSTATTTSSALHQPPLSPDPGARNERPPMSFQAYLDGIETETGLTPRQFLQLAHERGLDDPSVKATSIVQWLAEDYALGRGHAMALVHVIKKGPSIDPKHVGSGGTRADPSDTLWLDGKTTNPLRSPAAPSDTNRKAAR